MTSSEGFPSVDAEKELHPGKNKGLEVDPVSLEVATTKEIKEQAEERKKKDEEIITKQIEEERKKQAEETKECIQKFKTAVIVSGIIATVVGAIFAITKKLKQK